MPMSSYNRKHWQSVDDWMFDICESSNVQPDRFSKIVLESYQSDFFNDALDSEYAERGSTVKPAASTQVYRWVHRKLRIPLPPLATQQAIVAEIEAEQALVAANRELIARFEKKIQATLARVWGEDANYPLGLMSRSGYSDSRGY